jgi:transposase
LGQQTVVVVGTGAAGIVLPKLAEQLLSLRHQRDDIAAQVEALVEAHPLHKVLTSMPGIGVRTCARILTEVTGKDFASAAPPCLLRRHCTGDPVLWDIDQR